MRLVSRTQLAVMALLFLAYPAVRFYGIGSTCLWFDEIYSVHAAEHAWGELFHFVALDLIHPPLYYVVLKLWIAVGGEGVVWLRSLSVLFAAIAVFPFIRLCRELRISLWSQTFALFLLVVNGSLIKYAQEVRMYSLLLGLALFSLWLFVRSVNSGTGILALFLVNVLLVYTHYFGWLVIGAEVIAAAMVRRQKVWQVLMIGAGAAAAFVPWVFVLAAGSPTQQALNQNVGWIDRPGIMSILTMIFGLIEPFYYKVAGFQPMSYFPVTLPMVVILISAVGLALFSPAKLNSRDIDSRRLLVIFVGLPVLVAFAVSWLSPVSIWGTRHLIVIFPTCFILTGIIMGQISSPMVRSLLISAVLLLTALAGVNRWAAEAPACSWCVAGPLAKEAIAEREIPIAAAEDLIAYHLWRAAKESGARAEVIKINDLPGVSEDKAYFLPRGFDGVRRVTFPKVNENEFWFIVRLRIWDEDPMPVAALKGLGAEVSPPQVIAADDSLVELVRVTMRGPN